MKIKSLLFFVFLFVLARLTYGYREALPSEVRIELSSDKTEYALYEPVVLHLTVTYLGNYTSKEINSDLERVVFGYYPVWANGPFRPVAHTTTPPTRKIAVMPFTGPERAVLLPGESLERDFWIYPNTGYSVTASPGDYEVWIAPEGDWVDSNRRFESNHLKIKVVEPQGKEKEAFDCAKTPQRLLCLMNHPIGTMAHMMENEAKEIYGHRNPNLTEAIKFCQMFVHKAEGSAYHPFALFALSREYFFGWAETRKKPTKRKNTFSHEPDYELLLQSTDEFIKIYPDHLLADEIHFFRLVALYGLGKKEEAAKEYDLIHERLAPLEKMLWEQFRRTKGQEWEKEDYTKKLAEGPLYVLSAAEKVKDLFENIMANGEKRKTIYDFSYIEWPVQVRELEGLFKSRWSPR